MDTKPVLLPFQEEGRSNEMKELQEKVNEYEAALINIFGLIRVLLSTKDGGEMKDYKKFVEDIKPLSIKINERIRTDAVERAVAYLNGEGYHFTPEMVEGMKKASFRFRRLNNEDNPTAPTSTKQVSKSN